MADKIDKQIMAKLADIPMARPGFDTLDMTAPTLVQLNPQGKWENTKPASLDEDRLRAVVEHLVKSKALSAAQNYCCQCAEENKVKEGTASNYVPVIMMPIYPAEHCPFDMKCEAESIKEAKASAKAKKLKFIEKRQDVDSKEDKAMKSKKKRGFVLQRLTDFDLLSQW